MDLRRGIVGQLIDPPISGEGAGDLYLCDIIKAMCVLITLFRFNIWHGF